MITKRIIPCLDVRSGRVVKGTNFEGIRDVADPVEMARMYNAAGADELVFYDITASAEGRALFTDILRKVAETISPSFALIYFAFLKYTFTLIGKKYSRLTHLQNRKQASRKSGSISESNLVRSPCLHFM